MCTTLAWRRMNPRELRSGEYRSHWPLWLRLVSAANQDFVLDNKTGILTTNRTLNRENLESYSLSVILTDGKAQVELVVNVNVKYMNDNAPVFVGLQDYHSISITSELSRGAAVLKVEAVDKDSGKNGLVKYAIVSGNDGKEFYINRNGRRGTNS